MKFSFEIINSIIFSALMVAAFCIFKVKALTFEILELFNILDCDKAAVCM